MRFFKKRKKKRRNVNLDHLAMSLNTNDKDRCSTLPMEDCKRSMSEPTDFERRFSKCISDEMLYGFGVMSIYPEDLFENPHIFKVIDCKTGKEIPIVDAGGLEVIKDV